jgi:hypothetical protein
MRTRSVSKVLALTLLIFSMGLEAARLSNAASENKSLSRRSRICPCRAQQSASITRALTRPKDGFTSLT